MGVEIIKAIQSLSSPGLDRFFTLATDLYSEMAYIFVLPLLYWLIDKRLTGFLAHLFLAQYWVNEFAKEFFATSRPIGYPGIRSLALDTAEGQAFPSGHAQGMTAIWFGLATQVRRPWAWALATVLTALVALSRLYLGLHWPIDIAGGLVLGAAVVLLAEPVGRLFKRTVHSFAGELALALLLPLLLTVIHPGGHTAAAVLGVWAGFWVGQVWDRHRFHFSTRAPWPKQVLKAAIGLALVFAIRSGVKILLPDTYALTYLRYVFVGLTVTMFAPWLFRRLGLEGD